MEKNDNFIVHSVKTDKEKRPTSPHLSVYKLQQGSFLSIFTRITGLLLLCYMFFAKVLYIGYPWAFANHSYYVVFISLLSLTNRYPLLAFLVVFILVSLLGYHFILGVRYCVWFFRGDTPLHTTEIRKKREPHVRILGWILFFCSGPLLALLSLALFFDAFPDVWVSLP